MSRQREKHRHGVFGLVTPQKLLIYILVPGFYYGLASGRDAVNREIFKHAALSSPGP